MYWPVYWSNFKSCHLWTIPEELLVNTLCMKFKQYWPALTGQLTHVVDLSFGKCSFWNQRVEDDWFSIFIQYLVFILNTPAVTLQIVTRENLVRFMKYIAPWRQSNSGTGGQGGCGISVFGDLTPNGTRRWATWSKLVLRWVGFWWSPEVPYNLFYGSVVFVFCFFFLNLIY